MNRLVLVGLVLLTAGQPSAQEGVAGTRHNLSTSGPGRVRAESEPQICFFCHVPHRGGRGGSNRPDTSASYTTYASSTQAAAKPDVLNEATRLCLSCHDGTIALGQTRRDPARVETSGTGSEGTLPPGRANLGTDLRHSHPVSVAPPPSSQLRDPGPGSPVKYDAKGRVQCTSCHDPHQSANHLEGNFLVKSNRGSELCLSCHAKAYWQTLPSSHQSSLAIYDTRRGASTPFLTVADNGCMACHQTHGAKTEERLLKDAVSLVCMQCHSGVVAAKDLRADLAKPYAHSMGAGALHPVHDAAEGPQNVAHPLPETRASTPRHVECVDCHNPHATNAVAPIAPVTTSTAPRASGALAGVWGIDRNGQRVDPVQFEYEVCFKCHGDSANRPQRNGPRPPTSVRRPTADVRQAFDLSAASFHPVEGAGRNPDVPGLVPPLTSTSVISCSDCHASDTGPGAGGLGPAGPHGSSFPALLERSFATADFTAESASAYALCYKCHDREVLLSPASGFPTHRLHVQQSSVPCSACHDWHGVSALQGNPINSAHLINFDLSIVRPTAQGRLSYTSSGTRQGACSVACHGKRHDETPY